MLLLKAATRAHPHCFAWQAGNATKNSAIKRIMGEWKVMQRDEGKYGYEAHPTEDDIFEWHFTMHGPPDSDFSGGVYHGRINLPAEYPFKPPSIMLLTENGRFETNKKICLTISNYHPEHWQPSWDIRTIITALVAFMPSEGQGAIGSLDCPPEERRKMALQSRTFVCPKCGDSHEDFISRVPVPSSPTKEAVTDNPPIPVSPTSPATSAPNSPPVSPLEPPPAGASPEVAAACPPGCPCESQTGTEQAPRPASPPGPPPPTNSQPRTTVSTSPATRAAASPQQQQASSGGMGSLEWFAVALLVLIAGLLAKKFLK